MQTPTSLFSRNNLPESRSHHPQSPACSTCRKKAWCHCWSPWEVRSWWARQPCWSVRLKTLLVWCWWNKAAWWKKVSKIGENWRKFRFRGRIFRCDVLPHLAGMGWMSVAYKEIHKVCYESPLHNCIARKVPTATNPTPKLTTTNQKPPTTTNSPNSPTTPIDHQPGRAMRRMLE